MPAQWFAVERARRLESETTLPLIKALFAVHRPGIRGAAALTAALMGAACTNFAPPAAHAPAASPSASAAATTAPQLNWAEALSFSGDVKGTMYQVVVGDQGTRSECTGRNSRYGGAWASTLYGTVGKEVYGVLVTVRPYAGPGSYRVPVLSVQVSRPDGSAVWQTSGGDTATFVVGSDEESGTLQATLTDLNSNTTKLRLSGRWSCVT